jgi:hypothetical protein
VRKKGKETKKADEVLEGVLSQNVVRRCLRLYQLVLAVCVAVSVSFPVGKLDVFWVWCFRFMVRCKG